MAGKRWKKIPGFSDYDVSSSGDIRSHKRSGDNKSYRMMKLRVGSDGYPRVTLQDDAGVKRVRRVHLVVASAFLGPSKGKIVRHKNGNLQDYRLSNLEYGTQKENSKDRYYHGTHGVGSKNSQALITESEAKAIMKLKGVQTQVDIARSFGISRQAVSDIHRGKTWTPESRKKIKSRSRGGRFQ
jgi:hypothetical protein